jgi:hypothetical protein
LQQLIIECEPSRQFLESALINNVDGILGARLFVFNVSKPVLHRIRIPEDFFLVG